MITKILGILMALMFIAGMSLLVIPSIGIIVGLIRKFLGDI